MGSEDDKAAILTIAFAVLFLVGAIVIYNRTPSSCNMKIPKNRDFNKYYGIIDMKNHFTTTAADECGPSIIFRPALPQMILQPDYSASSFMILAKYGTGKTLLRCEYFRSVSSNNYLKVPILNQQISGYLDRFVSKMGGNETHCQTHNCLSNWSENEFAQLLLSTLVTEFINTYDNRKYQDISLLLDEKMNLITIICYYYNDLGTTKLESFVNSFLGEGFFLQYQSTGEIVGQNEYPNKQLLKHLKDDLKKFSILNQDYQRLHLLLDILEGEGFQSGADTKHLYGNSFQDLIQFSSFIKKYFKTTPTFVIDGIDENKYFFQKNGINNASLESFCRSSVSQSILSIVMAHHFYLSLFYPEIDDVNIEGSIMRKDKFPIHRIKWNAKSLINYADYVLHKMNDNATKTRCRAFTDFKTLVTYSNVTIAKIIEKIPTPRALHYFMTELMREMNNDANDVKKPFEATLENVNNAYKESSKHFEKSSKR